MGLFNGSGLMVVMLFLRLVLDMSSLNFVGGGFPIYVQMISQLLFVLSFTIIPSAQHLVETILLQGRIKALLSSTKTQGMNCLVLSGSCRLNYDCQDQIFSVLEGLPGPQLVRLIRFNTGHCNTNRHGIFKDSSIDYLCCLCNEGKVLVT